MLLFSGCAQMVTLSDSDEDKIAVYASGVVNKFNKNGAKGIVAVVMPAPGSEGSSSEGGDDEGGSGGGGSTVGGTDRPFINNMDINTPHSDGGESTLTGILGVEGVSFSYKGMTVSSDFVSDGAFMVQPQEGNAFLVVKYNAENVSGSEVSFDLGTKGLNFTAQLQGITCVSERSILPDNLTNYSGTLQPGETKELTVLFQFPSTVFTDLSELKISAIIDHIRYEVTF